jgi:exonuclease SbcC
VAADQERKHCDAEVERIRGDLANVATRRAAVTEQLAKRDKIQAAVDAAKGLGDKLAAVEAEIVALRQAKDEHATAHAEWKERADGAEGGVLLARNTLHAAIKTAASDMQAAELAVAKAETLANELGALPCRGEGDFAVCPLIDAATTAKRELPALVATVETCASRLTCPDEEAVYEEAKLALIAVGPQPEAPGIDSLRGLEDDARRLRQEVHFADVNRAKLEDLADADDMAAGLEQEAEILREQKDQAQEARTNAMGLSKAHDTRVQALCLCIDVHSNEQPDVVDEAALAQLRREESEAVAEMAKAKEALAHAERAAKQIDEMRNTIAESSAALDDWKHLQKAFGREGIQALEVDAAGPEVSGLINELLRACYGSRFTATLETTALKKDGKGSKEIFDLRVVDSERGTDGSASDLSGGERVIVSEALSLAIAIFNARKSSIPILDLWRDECAGALDYQKAPLYVEMLRCAREIGGFNRVYFVAHNRELWGLADAQLTVTDGQCGLEGV